MAHRPLRSSPRKLELGADIVAQLTVSFLDRWESFDYSEGHWRKRHEGRSVLLKVPTSFFGGGSGKALNTASVKSSSFQPQEFRIPAGLHRYSSGTACNYSRNVTG